MKKFVPSTVAVLISAVFATSVNAAQTEWFLGKDRAKAGKVLKGKLLQKIECRDSDRRGLNLNQAEFRLTYTDNPNKTKYWWAVGDHYGRIANKVEREGYKLVSINQYVRKKSGLKIRCAVWHKK